MENRAHALAAGLFTLLLGCGVVVAAMWFSGNTTETVGYVLESKYPVTGLNLQAPVRLRGVEVGKVDSIEFDPDDPQLILIGIGVKDGTPVTQGTVARLGSQGVTGLAYVMLEDDGTNPKPLPPSDEKSARIPVRQALLDELSGSGRELLAEVGKVARQLNELLGEKNQAQLLRTLVNLESATRQVAVLAHAIEPGVKALPALTAEARRTLARADTLFASLNTLTQQLAQRVDALDRVAKSAERIGGATQALSGTVVTETLPRINALVEDLARNSRDLERLLSDLDDQPYSLVFGRAPVPPGPGEPGFDPQRGSSP